MTREQLYEYIMGEQDKNMQKHPELAMNKMAAISGMIAQAKIEGAREVIEEIAQAFRKHGVTYMLNKLNELEERYEVETIIEFGKYSGYKVKCPCCKTKFTTSFDELELGFLTGNHFTYCPCCHKTVWKTLFWRKIK